MLVYILNSSILPSNYLFPFSLFPKYKTPLSFHSSKSNNSSLIFLTKSKKIVILLSFTYIVRKCQSLSKTFSNLKNEFLAKIPKLDEFDSL